MKTWLFFFSIVLSLLISSCNTTEEIWINKDGSLRREWKMDMSALMPFIKMANESKDSMSTDSLEMLADEPVEEGAEEAEDEFDKLFSKMLERDNVDTLIAFRDIIKEAMAKEGLTEDQMWQALAESDEMGASEEEKEDMKALIKTLTNTQLRINMSESKGVYFFSLIQEFADIDELNAGQDVMSALSALRPGKGSDEDPTQDAMMKMMTGSNPTYSLEKKKFRLSRPAADLSQLSDEAQESMQMMQMFMGAMEYEYVIHFPKRVKKVSHKDAEIIDGNTVRIKAPMPQIGEKSEAFDLTVKF